MSAVTEATEATEATAPLLTQLRTLTQQRRAFESQLDKINAQRAPVDRAIKANDEATAQLRDKLKAAMRDADTPSVGGNGISAVIIVGRSTEIIDQDAAVAAIAELGRINEITKVTYDKVAIKRISDGQVEPLPGIEVCETRALRVTVAP